MEKKKLFSSVSTETKHDVAMNPIKCSYHLDDEMKNVATFFLFSPRDIGSLSRETWPVR